EQCATSATSLARAADQSRNLDELDEHTADARQRRDRPRGRERVGPGLDLDARERLQERRLAGVRRAGERNLGRALTAHSDRVTMDDTRPGAGCVELGVD